MTETISTTFLDSMSPVLEINSAKPIRLHSEFKTANDSSQFRKTLLSIQLRKLIADSTEDGVGILSNKNQKFTLHDFGVIEKILAFYFNVTNPSPQDNTESTTVDNTTLESLNWIKETTGLSYERISKLIGVTRQTIDRWKRGEPILDVNRVRLLAVKEILERAFQKNNSQDKLLAWLDSPRGLDGKTPAYFLESNELDKARFYALSGFSTRLSQPKIHKDRKLPTAWENSKELGLGSLSLEGLADSTDGD